MSIPIAFKYNSNAKYSIGGVYAPSHEFSLVHQTITIKQNGSFEVRFPDIWLDYKLPKITDSKKYDAWKTNPMAFWQNQLNFAVWAATTGCGISKQDHLRNKDPIIRSIFRFHVYYQIRRILNEMQCPIPNDFSFNALDNPYDKNAFERICAEFGISPQSDFRQKLDHSHGMGAVRYYSLHGLKSRPTKVLERAGDFDPSQHWTVFIPSSGKFGVNDQHRYKIEYIEQCFSKGEVDSRMRAINPKTGSKFDAIGTFVLDKSEGFTQAGIARINDSIRTYVWAILGAQAQTRSSILGTGKAFDAQKQFLANVEDAVNSAVNIPGSIERYQSTLQYARSRVNFVLGIGLYMIPNDMGLYVGTINGFNNLIVIASPDEISKIQLGYNNTVNDDPLVPQETFETPPKDFEAPQNTLELEQRDEEIPELQDTLEPPEDDEFQNTPQKDTLITDTDSPKKDIDITHDEKKLLITLGGITAASFLIWFLK